MRIYPDIHSFIGGLLTPKLEGRVDYAKYGVGCRVLENMIVTPTGGIYKRPGFHFVAKAKTNKVRLIPFDFNGTETQSYVLEIGDGYIRFFSRQGQVVDENNDPLELVVPQLVRIDLTQLSYTQSADVIYFAHPLMQPWRLERLSAMSWAYQPMTFLDDGEETAAATLAARTATFEAESITLRQYQNATDAAQSQYAQALNSGDQSLIAQAQAALDTAIAQMVAQEGVVAGARTAMEAAAAAVEAGGNGLPFYGDNFPSKVRIYEDRLVYAATPRQPLNIWMSRLADYNDFRLNTNTQVDDSTMEPLPEDSIWLRIAGSRVNPIMWMLDVEQLVVGTNASEIRIQGRDIDTALTPATAGHKRQSSYGSNGVQAIMLGSSAMFCSRTGNDLYTLDYQDFGYRFKAAPLNLLCPEATKSGVVEMHSMGEPEPVAWCILADGTFAGCTYIRDQQIFAWHHHNTRGKVRSGAIIPFGQGDQFWVAIERPLAVVQGVTQDVTTEDTANDGTTTTKTTTRLVEEVVGDKIITTVTVTVTSFPNNNISDVTVVSTTNTVTESDVETEMFIEYLEFPFDYLADNAMNNVFMDSMLSGIATENGRIMGLPYLAGHTVQVVADGSYVGELPVLMDGSVNDTKIMAGAYVVAGLEYIAEVQPMRPNYAIPVRQGGGGGQSVHFKKRIVEVVLRALGSIKGEVRAEYEQPVPGLSEGEFGPWQELVAFPHGAVGGLPPPCRTETVHVSLSGNSTNDGLIRVRQAEPFPLFLTAIAYGIEQPQGV